MKIKNILIKAIFALTILYSSQGYSQLYNIKIDNFNFNEWNDSGQCGNAQHLWLKIHFETGNPETVYCQSCNNGNNLYDDTTWNLDIDRNRKPISIESDAFIKEKSCVLGVCTCDGNTAEWNHVYKTLSGCMEATYTYSHHRGDAELDLSYRIRITPLINILSPDNGTQVGQEENFNITATSGFPSNLYKWQYHIPGDDTVSTTPSQCTWGCYGGGGGAGGVIEGNTESACQSIGQSQSCNSSYTPETTTSTENWHNVPNNYPGGYQLNNVAPSDLSALLPNYIGNIHFRIKSCDTDSDLTDIILEIVPSPPGLDTSNGDAVEPINETCAGDNSAGFIAHFDRDLQQGEILNYLVVNVNNPSVNIIATSVNSLDSTNSFTRNYPFPSGVYKITFKSEIDGILSSPVFTTFTITNPTPVTFTATTTNVTCFGSCDGKITLIPSGGNNTAYQYKIISSSREARNIPGGSWHNFPSNNILTRCAGTYTIKIRDANYCESSPNTFTLTEPDNPIILSLNEILTTEPTANGLSNGVITVNVSGGMPNNGAIIDWTATWSGGTINGNRPAIIDNTSHTFVVNNIGAGAYTLIGHDSNGCDFNFSVSLNEPLLLEIANISTTPISCNSANIGDCATCNQDGSLTVNAIGGVELDSGINNGLPYYYTWEQKINGSWVSISGQNNPTLSGLGEGEYAAIITDANGIIRREETILNEPQAISIPISHSGVRYVSCHGGNDGYIHPNSITGGAGNNTFQWLDVDDNNQVIGTNLYINNLSEGIYTLVVTDGNGCMASTSITITQPDTISITIDSITQLTSPGSNEGGIHVTVNGGRPSYTYNWVNQDNVGVGNTEDITGLVAGIYHLIVRDSNNCIYNMPTGQYITINEVFPLEVSLYGNYIYCYGGNNGYITANVQGGIPFNGLTYNYHWYKRENVDTIIDLNVTTKTITNLEAGIYFVIVTDSEGNTITSIDKVLRQPDEELLIDDFEKQNIRCFGNNTGYAYVMVTGGESFQDDAYYFEWFDEDNNLIKQSFQQFEDEIYNLAAGNYHVVIHDYDCEVALDFTITQPDTALAYTLESNTPTTGYGYTDGVIDITTYNGTSPYTFSWKDSNNIEVATTEDLINFGAGDYHLVITDNNSCRLEEDFTITQPTEIIINPSFEPILCNGGTTTLTIDPTGGIPGYTIEWYNNDTNVLIGTASSDGTEPVTLTNKIAGNYRVEVTDSNGIMVSYTFEVEQNDAITFGINQITNVSCYGESTGSITINVSGGTGAYTFLWNDSNESTTQNLENVPAGNYSVTITDENNCFITSDEIEINNSSTSAITISNETVIDITGNGLHDGAININVTGGIAPYTYQWSGSNNYSSTSSSINELYPGNYNVVIIDSLGCELTNNYTITQPELLTIVSINQDLFNNCYGDSNAQLTATISGGVAPYTYTWEYQENTDLILPHNSTIDNLSAGTYNLTIIDDNGNTTTTSIPIIITQPTEILLNSSIVTDVNCFEEQTGAGAIDVSIIGGTGSYTYQWSNGETTENLTNLSAGTYTLIVTDEPNLCIKTFEFEVTQPNIAMQIDNHTLVEPLGNGLYNGSIEVNVIGGTPTYVYQWFDIDDNLLTTQISNLLNNVAAGTYKVIITDTNGCITEATYVLEQPEPLEIELLYDEISCYGYTTEITTNVLGGVINNGNTYQYQWFDNDNNLIGTEDAINLSQGSYHIIVTDSNNIQSDFNFILTQPNEIEISASIINIDCPETNTGSIQLEVNGGTGNYTFDWSNGIHTKDIANLYAGNYSVVVYDDNGCSVTSDNFEITQPDSINIQTDQVSPPSGFGLEDGFINITITGGTSPYSYQWTNDNGGVVSINEDVFGLAIGTYSLLITDNNNCSISTIYNLDEPEELTIEIQQNEMITCYEDASAALEALPTGGGGGNTFTWYNTNDTNNSIYTSSNTLINNLIAGSYYVVVTDANGITVTSEILTITQPDAILVTTQTTNLLCFEANDGTIELEAEGGSGSYLYRIKQGSNIYSDWISFTGTSITLENLIASNYTIQVKDTNDCSFENDGVIESISITITQPSLLEISDENISNLTGFETNDGAIDITINGGTPPYVYQWNNTSNTISVDEDITGLSAGNYTVIITDSNNCEISNDFIITQPDILTVVLEQQNEILCYDSETASITTTISGGVVPYTYQWFIEGESDVIGDNSLLNNIAVGTYYVIVTDANDNSITSSNITMEQPEELEVSFSATYTNCGTENNWQVEAEVTGGTAPYNYSWSTGNDTSIIIEQQIGTFMLIISDDNGCQITQTYTIEEPEYLTVEADVVNLTCFDVCDGEINLDISGGTAPYDVLWDDESTEINRTNLCEGTYEVTVTDQNGCEFNHSYELTNPEEITIGLENQVTTLCNDQYLELDVTINDEDAIYLWESANGFSSNSPIVVLEDEGVYTITITTSDGCEITDTVDIINSNIGLNAQFLVTSQAFAGEDIIIINTSNPITEDMEWIVSNDVQIIEQNSETITLRFNTEGAYELSLLTNIGDCEDYYSKTIIVNEARDLPDVGDADAPFITDFIIYPNPNNGNYDVSITLSEPANISLRLFSLVSQTPLDDRMESGLTEYNLNYGLTNLSSGVYFLLLETPHGSQIKKVIIE